MRKVLSYIIFFAIWMDTTSLSQLVKLPILVSHYVEHQQVRSNLGFFQFLSMHYWGDDDNDDDNDRDMQLPFKKIDLNSFQTLFTPVVKDLVRKQTYAPERSRYLPATHSFWLNATLRSLFRPPRA